MMTTSSENGDLLFAEDSAIAATPKANPWRILIVDDDAEIHRVTRLVLSPFVFKDKPMEILSAYSGLEARSLLASNIDISVILLDVVMETDDSGLRLVHFIRQQYANRKTRIILRTGQPGYAPELRVLLDYDINDYRAKAELTAERLLTAVAVSLRSYNDIETAEHATAQNQIAQEAVIAKSTFLANMSHELRTPLNAVIGNIELLRLTPLTPRQIDIADSAATAARILMDVIGDVLDLSKLESDRFELDSVPVNLNDLFRDVRDVVMANARSKGLSLNVHCASDVPRDVVTDPIRLRQIVVNLLANAVKFTAVGGVLLNVRVVSRRTGVVVVRFEVCDSGIGFDPAKAAALFEPFVQGENSIVRKYGGTGLGLAISKRAVELLGGNIGCRAIPGAGSTFWCELPLIAANGRNAEGTGGVEGLHVLVVGEPGTRPLSARLSDFGLKSDQADDVTSALLMLDTIANVRARVAVVVRWPAPACHAIGALLGLSGKQVTIVAVVDHDDDRQVYEAIRGGAQRVLRDDELAELPSVLAEVAGG